MTARPGSRPRPASPSASPATRTRHDEREHDGHPAHDPDTGLDAWVRELVDAAPPLTGQQRRTLALLLNSPGPVPARPARAAVPDQLT
jgi:hypothetical protein